MRGLLIIIALLLAPVCFRSVVQLHDKWDDTPEYVSAKPYPLATLNKETGEQVDHVGPYRAGETLTYVVRRTASRTVTAITTRRIVQRVKVSGGTARIPIFTYPSQTGTRIEANAPDHEVTSYIPIQLPDAKVLPTGSDFVVETSVEFSARGDHDAHTYTGESIPFSVVE